MPLESLVEVQGNYVKDLAPERLEALRRLFPEVDLETEGLKLVHEDPPVLVLENVLTDEECCAFVESMRGEDGSFPERLGQANLDVPNWLNPLRTAFRGVPVLDWLGNPTVRWTYRSRCLLDGFLQKVREKCGLDTSFGQANIKHYRKEQWLPVHIDYNRATMLTSLH
ncbi:Prolyl 4-hydroxylase subunit alpha-1 [Durusdinium trenchii]|uniref:Prolyl 4-hydroxylase subunit alpha-1 n=1 Tax=Durusdinium trenchii TaxID=1381693 RepID=A0ABP0SCI7_9DINO